MLLFVRIGERSLGDIAYGIKRVIYSLLGERRQLIVVWYIGYSVQRVIYSLFGKRRESIVVHAHAYHRLYSLSRIGIGAVDILCGALGERGKLKVVEICTIIIQKVILRH